MAEALAARRAMVFARELSLFNVILEGDFLWVIQALIYLGRCNTLVTLSMRLRGLGVYCGNVSFGMFVGKGID